MNPFFTHCCGRSVSINAQIGDLRVAEAASSENEVAGESIPTLGWWISSIS
jgi:hypothetical protein